MTTTTRSSAADHVRPTPWDGVVVLCVLLAAAALLLVLRPRAQEGPLTAVITVDGQETAVLPLSGAGVPTEETTLRLDVPYPLTVAYGPEGIRVSEAQCPGGDCLHTGRISRAGQQIVCLPNRVIISIRGGGASSIDAVTG